MYPKISYRLAVFSKLEQSILKFQNGPEVPNLNDSNLLQQSPYFNKYSQTCMNQPFKNEAFVVFMNGGRLTQNKHNAESSHKSFLHYRYVKSTLSDNILFYKVAMTPYFDDRSRQV